MLRYHFMTKMMGVVVHNPGRVFRKTLLAFDAFIRSTWGRGWSRDMVEAHRLPEFKGQVTLVPALSLTRRMAARASACHT